MTNRFFYVSLMLVGLLSCAGDEPRVAASIPDESVLMTRIAHGDPAVLDTVQPTLSLVRTLRRAAPAHPYILGRAYEARGLYESARFVFLNEIEEGFEPWNGRSALRAARRAGMLGRWVAAEGYAGRSVELLPRNRDGWYWYGASLYRQERYGDLLDLVADMPLAADLDSGEEYTSAALAAERLLWTAVAGYELGRDGPERFVEAFVRAPAQAIHTRLYLYLYYRDASFPRFRDREQRLLEAVYRGAREEYAEARRLFALLDPDWIGELLTETPENRALLVTLERVAGSGSPAFESWLERIETHHPELDLRAIRARSLESRGNHDAALALRGALIEDGAGDSIRDWVQSTIRAGRPVDEVVARLLRWDADDGEYSLAVDRLLPVVVSDRRWNDVEALYRMLPAAALETRAHVGVVTVLAAREGYLELTDDEVADRLAVARSLSEISYYGLLARRLSGTPAELDRNDESPAQAGASPEGLLERDDEMGHVAAVLAAGMPGAALRWGMALALNPAVRFEARLLAHRFYALGHASAGLDLMRRAVNRGDGELRYADIPLLYPRPYALEIEAAASEYGVPPEILYGLIREESHFNPRAQSPVGATGLAQVMPATAEDLVRRLGWAGVDLESVSDSVRMGAFYLDLLGPSLDGNMILQLASYNAGPGRGRRWNNSFGDLAPELQIEALPFIETRWYLRRIAVSSAWYRALIHDSDPARDMPLFP